MSALSLVPPQHRQLFIGGEWVPARDKAVFEVIDPADESVICEVADASPEDALAALDAADAAQDSWAATPPRERGEILRRTFEAVMDQAKDVAELISLEMGKPVAEAHGEIVFGAEFFRWFAEEAPRINGSWLAAPGGGSRFLTMRRPVGPCLLITPWNFPLAMAARKIGPAIAAGCTMVVKPAEATPLTTLAVTHMLTEAGLPAGVLNVVTSLNAAGVSETLMNDPRLRKVSFTGSTRVGKLLVQQSAHQLQRLSMELGGNAPFIVFEDADLDAAIEGAIIAKMRNMGETCVAANRFFVHESLAEEFAERLGARMSGMPVGRGQDAGVLVGPLINAAAVTNVGALVDEAVRDGARVIAGGGPVEGPGYFFKPTVLADVPQTSRIANSEIFGPVAAVTTFTTEAEVIARANDTEYGLASYVYTNNTSRTIRMAEALHFGMVGFNTGLMSNAAAPFGGVKQSGYGREGGFEGIDEYVETRYVNIPV
jgi:succinate-semialdehyde dehydrogenase / glutarate-semialdehyde dehydrogenase